MTKPDLITHISHQYGVAPDFVFAKYPDLMVFRHSNKKAKWFCLLMNITPDKFGINTDAATIDIINIKADPVWIGSLCQIDGVYPAYHMNKGHWVSVWLDKVTDDDIITWLANSYALTAG